ncbi:MAG: hypothetical protein MUF80_11350, partial [Burkholderiales bacterium]|nr:hypothetical protein [Burkholderiales bacterium]
SNRRGGTAQQKPSGQVPDKTTGKTNMTQVNSILGLKPDASEDAAVAEIGAIKNRAGLYDALKTSHEALLDSLAESDLTAHGITDAEERKAVKPMLISNRASALALLAKSKAAAPAVKAAAPAIHNRAKTPDPVADKPQAADADGQKAFVESLRVKNRCTFREAWNLARSEKPELFATPEVK